MKKNDNYDLITRFFDFDLNEEELAAFDKRLENDEAFFDEVSQVERSQKMIAAMFDKDIVDEKNRLKKEILKKIRSSDQATPVVQMPSSKWKYMLAVAATIAMLVAAFLFWPSPSPDYRAIADNFYQNTNHLSHSGNRNEEMQTDLEKAFLHVEKKAYEDALLILQSIPASFSAYEDVLMLEGRCYFEMNKIDTAVEKFEAVLQLPDGNQEGLASWYLALTALKDGELDVVQNKLNDIIDGDFPSALQEKAIMLQQELQNSSIPSKSMLGN